MQLYKNIALSRPITTPQTVCNSSTENVTNLVDGSLTTKWCSDDAVAGPVWADIDLGGIFRLSHCKITHAASEDPSIVTYDFDLLVSIDGNSWTIAQSVRANTSDPSDHVFPSVLARFFRVYVINGVSPTPAFGGNSVRIYECEIYGVPAGRTFPMIGGVRLVASRVTVTTLPELMVDVVPRGRPPISVSARAPAAQDAPLLPLTPTAGIQFYPGDTAQPIRRQPIQDVSVTPIMSMTTTIDVSSWRGQQDQSRPVRQVPRDEPSNPLLPVVTIKDTSWAHAGPGWQFRTKPFIDVEGDESAPPIMPKPLSDTSWQQPPPITFSPKPKASSAGDDTWRGPGAFPDLSWSQPHPPPVIPRPHALDVITEAWLGGRAFPGLEWVQPHPSPVMPRPRFVDFTIDAWLSGRSFPDLSWLQPHPPAIAKKPSTIDWSVVDSGFGRSALDVLSWMIPEYPRWRKPGPSLVELAEARIPFLPVFQSYAPSWLEQSPDVLARRLSPAQSVEVLVQPIPLATFTDLSWAYREPIQALRRAPWAHQEMTTIRPLVVTSLSSWGWIPEGPLTGVKKPLGFSDAALLSPLTGSLQALGWLPEAPYQRFPKPVVSGGEVFVRPLFLVRNDWIVDGWQAQPGRVRASSAEWSGNPLMGVQIGGWIPDGADRRPPQAVRASSDLLAMPLSALLSAYGWAPDDQRRPNRGAPVLGSEAFVAPLFAVRMDWLTETQPARSQRSQARSAEALVQPIPQIFSLEWAAAPTLILAHRVIATGESVLPARTLGQTGYGWDQAPAARSRVASPSRQDDRGPLLTLVPAVLSSFAWNVNENAVRPSRVLSAALFSPIVIVYSSSKRPMIARIGMLPARARATNDGRTRKG